MKEPVSSKGVSYKGYLIRNNSTYFVPTSHEEIDSLIGRLMQMCDLIGDVEQRSALKSTIKQITRDWLDQEYANRGYDKWAGPNIGSYVIDTKVVESKSLNK